MEDSDRSDAADTEDKFYQALMELHDNLDAETSAALNARLVLLMSNEIGDLDRVKAIMHLAKSIS